MIAPVAPSEARKTRGRQEPPGLIALLQDETSEANWYDHVASPIDGLPLSLMTLERSQYALVSPDDLSRVLRDLDDAFDLVIIDTGERLWERCRAPTATRRAHDLDLAASWPSLGPLRPPMARDAAGGSVASRHRAHRCAAELAVSAGSTSTGASGHAAPALRRLRPAFLATVLLVTLQPTTIIIGYPVGLTLYLPEVAIWLVFIPFAAATCLMGRRDPVSAGLAVTPEVFAYCAVAALAALISLGLDGASDTPGKVKNLLAPLFLLCLILYAIDTTTDIHRIVWAVLAGSIANASIGLSQYLLAGPIIVEPHENNVWKEALAGGYLARTAHGLFDTPNALGVALAPSFVLAARLAFSGLNTGWTAGRALLLSSTLLIGAGLVASAHRGALIWALIGCVVAFAPMRCKMTFSIAVGLACTLALSLMGLVAMRDPGGFGTLALRVALWEGALAFFLERPDVALMGDGDTDFAMTAARVADWALPMTHNAWLDQILFFGLFGFLAYLAAWIIALWRVTSVRRIAQPSTLPLADSLAGALVALAGILVLEPRADGVYSVGQVFILFALIGRLATLQRERGSLSARALG